MGLKVVGPGPTRSLAVFGPDIHKGSAGPPVNVRTLRGVPVPHQQHRTVLCQRVLQDRVHLMRANGQGAIRRHPRMVVERRYKVHVVNENWFTGHQQPQPQTVGTGDADIPPLFHGQGPAGHHAKPQTRLRVGDPIAPGMAVPQRFPERIEGVRCHFLEQCHIHLVLLKGFRGRGQVLALLEEVGRHHPKFPGRCTRPVQTRLPAAEHPRVVAQKQNPQALPHRQRPPVASQQGPQPTGQPRGTQNPKGKAVDQVEVAVPITEELPNHRPGRGDDDPEAQQPICRSLQDKHGSGGTAVKPIAESREWHPRHQAM